MAHVLTMIGVDLTLKCINSITGTTQTIYGLISGIKGEKQIEVTKFLTDTDIEATIKVLESLLQELDVDKHTSKTLNLCLTEMEEVIKEINVILKMIHDRLLFNNSLYVLKSWRSWKFTEEIEKLGKLNEILHNRWKLLRDVLAIKESLQKQEIVAQVEEESLL